MSLVTSGRETQLIWTSLWVTQLGSMALRSWNFGIIVAGNTDRRYNMNLYTSKYNSSDILFIYDNVMTMLSSIVQFVYIVMTFITNYKGYDVFSIDKETCTAEPINV